MRIGNGYDVHRLAAGASLVLGGVQIKARQGAVGHSDADVLTHAVCDALLGALALGDIGQHFPDTDPKYKGIASLRLLEAVMQKVQAAGYGVLNMDSIVLLERPLLRPHLPQIRRSLASVLGIAEGLVSVKATTSERMGFVGRKEGVAAYAVVLLAPNP